MDTVRWGIIGCGNVTEVKSGPGFQKAEGSDLVAVMRRDADKAADYARRHGVPRSYGRAEDLISDAEVDAVYVATPPDAHCELALAAARAGKPCLVEKPMALDYGECSRMVAAFHKAQVPLFVAYYRRTLPRFLKARELLRAGAIGSVTSVHITQYARLAQGEKARTWRFVPEMAGGGLFADLASHGLDILDFLLGPVRAAAGFSVNTGGTYKAEDVTTACFEFESGCVGTGVWNFNADFSADRITITGSDGELECPVFGDTDIVVSKDGEEESFAAPNPPHVHQPLIQTIVDELQGKGMCESTGESGARTAWVMDACLRSYYRDRKPE